MEKYDIVLVINGLWDARYPNLHEPGMLWDKCPRPLKRACYNEVARDRNSKERKAGDTLHDIDYTAVKCMCQKKGPAKQVRIYRLSPGTAVAQMNTFINQINGVLKSMSKNCTRMSFFDAYRALEPRMLPPHRIIGDHIFHWGWEARVAELQQLFHAIQTADGEIAAESSGIADSLSW